MAIDPWIARGSPGLDVSNTLARIGALKQRDQVIQQDAQQNALYTQRYNDQQAQAQAAAQAEEESDRLWNEAIDAGDFETAARISPEDTKLWIESQDKIKQFLQPPPAKRDIREVGNTLLEVPQEGDPRVLYTAPQQPRQPAEPPKPALVTVNNPDGTTSQKWLRPGETDGVEVGAPKAPGQVLAPKDINTARTKLTQVKVARQQLNVAKQKFAALKDSISAGPGGNFVPTPSGKAFDAAIDTMRGSITALTKVPGLGSMSDFETRLDQAKFPNRGQYEDVSLQQLKAIEDLLNTVEGGYSEMLGQAPAAAKAEAQASPAAKAAPQPGANVRGYIFIGGDPKDKKNWVKDRSAK